MAPYIGEIRLIAGNYAPAGWALCQGQRFPILENEGLFNLIGTTFGGDGENDFAIPDLRGRIPIHQGNGRTLGESGGVESVVLTLAQIAAHNHALKSNPIDGNSLVAGGNVPAGAKGGLLRYSGAADANMHSGAIGTAGGGQAHENMMPFTTLNFIISLFGLFPNPNDKPAPEDRDQILGEIRMTGFGFVPKGWAPCDGQSLAVSTNQALFSVIGVTYGGDGQVSFLLPNLKARVPLNFDASHALGQSSGEVDHTISVAELPAHSHPLRADGANATSLSPLGNTPARIGSSGTEQYAGTPDVDMHSGSITSSGEGQAHTNLQPFLTLYFMIATQGDFPDR